VQEVFRENRASRVDSSLASALGASLAFYDDRRDVAIEAAQAEAKDPALQKAATESNFPQIAAILRQHPISWLSTAYADPTGRIVAGTPPAAPAFVQKVPLVGANGAPVGTVLTGFTLDETIAGQLSDGDVAVGFRNGQQLVTQDGPRPVTLPLTRGLKPFGAAQRTRSVVYDLLFRRRPRT